MAAWGRLTSLAIAALLLERAYPYSAEITEIRWPLNVIDAEAIRHGTLS